MPLGCSTPYNQGSDCFVREDMATMEEEALLAKEGRPTIIAKYCQRQSEESAYTECVFLCLKRGRKHSAIHVPLDSTLDMDRLRRECGQWWKRYSLYSAIAVREVVVSAL